MKKPMKFTEYNRDPSRHRARSKRVDTTLMHRAERREAQRLVDAGEEPAKRRQFMGSDD